MSNQLYRFKPIDPIINFIPVTAMNHYGEVIGSWVPVEPCRHGFIMPHHVTLEMTYKNDEDNEYTQRCAGAALNGDK